MFRNLLMSLFFVAAGAAHGADIRLEVGDVVTLGRDRISCGVTTGESAPTKCPKLFSSDPNLQNCSEQFTGTSCIQRNSAWGFCRQPQGGAQDWCVCMPN